MDLFKKGTVRLELTTGKSGNRMKKPTLTQHLKLILVAMGLLVSCTDKRSFSTFASSSTAALGLKITALTPNFGPASGGTTITVFGSGIVPGTKITIAGFEYGCTNDGGTSGNPTNLSCRTVATTPGVYDVIMTLPSGETSTLPKAFTFLSLFAPSLSSVSPAVGVVGGGTAITILGSAFDSKAQVLVGNAPCLAVVVVSSTKITCTTPPGTFGPKTVTVINPDTQTGSLANSFNYIAGMIPAIASVSPNYGPTTGNQTITITGAGFLAGLLVTIGGLDCSNVVVVSINKITCKTPVGTNGAKTLAITNPDGQTISLANAYTYREPSTPLIATISPSYGALGGGTTITLNGSGFLANATIFVGGLDCPSVSIISPTKATCVTPAGTYGAKNVILTNTDGQSSTLTNGFFYREGMGPSIAAISPNYGSTAGGDSVTITGAGFSANSVVTIGAIDCLNFNFVSSNKITCTTPPGANGAKNVIVSNPDGQNNTLTSGFTYRESAVPTIISISPGYGPLTGGTTITINGAGFLANAIITVGGLDCRSVTVVSATKVTCITPASTAGAKNVILTNPDGQTVTLTSGFFYRDGMGPSISAINPSWGPPSGNTTITITGAGFSNNAVVTIGGVDCTSITVISAAKLTCVTPSGSYGSKNVIVYNSDGQSNTLTNGFSYRDGMTPTIATISPSYGPINTSTAITITGAGFVTGAAVTIGNLNCTNVVVVSNSTITCDTPPGTAGAKAVAVINPDTQAASLATGYS